MAASTASFFAATLLTLAVASLAAQGSAAGFLKISFALFAGSILSYLVSSVLPALQEEKATRGLLLAAQEKLNASILEKMSSLSSSNEDVLRAISKSRAAAEGDLVALGLTQARAQAELQRQMDGLREVLANVTTDRDGLREALSSITTDRDGLREALSSITTDRDGLREALSSLTTDRDGLREALSCITTDRDGLREKEEKQGEDEEEEEESSSGPSWDTDSVASWESVKCQWDPAMELTVRERAPVDRDIVGIFGRPGWEALFAALRPASAHDIGRWTFAHLELDNWGTPSPSSPRSGAAVAARLEGSSMGESTVMPRREGREPAEDSWDLLREWGVDECGCQDENFIHCCCSHHESSSSGSSIISMDSNTSNSTSSSEHTVS